MLKQLRILLYRLKFRYFILVNNYDYIHSDCVYTYMHVCHMYIYIYTYIYIYIMYLSRFLHAYHT